MSNDMDDYSIRLAALRAEYPILTVGLELNVGWFGIVREWLAEVTAILNAHPNANFRIKQIKEKLASIRLYTDASDDISLPVRKATHLAEARALRTCEICGAEGHPVDDHGYYRVSCREHADDARPMPSDRELNPLDDGMGGFWRYEPAIDDLVHEPVKSVAQLFEIAAEATGEAIEHAVIGAWMGVSADGWPRWGERVPANRRGVVQPWPHARLLLDYKPELPRQGIRPEMNPVYAWTTSSLLLARIHYYHIEIVVLPRAPVEIEPKFA